MLNDDTPHVWVGCLGCYNNGALVGEWFDADECPTDMADFDALVKPLVSHVAEHHEELWVFDHENFHGLLAGECSPMDARAMADVLARVQDAEAFGVYVSECLGRDYAAKDWGAVVAEFEDAYCGEWGSGAEYAQGLAEELGAVTDQPVWPMGHVDWNGAWQELTYDGYVYEKGYVFRPV